MPIILGLRGAGVCERERERQGGVLLLSASMGRGGGEPLLLLLLLVLLLLLLLLPHSKIVMGVHLHVFLLLSPLP